MPSHWAQVNRFHCFAVYMKINLVPFSSTFKPKMRSQACATHMFVQNIYHAHTLSLHRHIVCYTLFRQSIRKDTLAAKLGQSLGFLDCHGLDLSAAGPARLRRAEDHGLVCAGRPVPELFIPRIRVVTVGRGWPLPAVPAARLGRTVRPGAFPILMRGSRRRWLILLLLLHCCLQRSKNTHKS